MKLNLLHFILGHGIKAAYAGKRKYLLFNDFLHKDFPAGNNFDDVQAR